MKKKSNICRSLTFLFTSTRRYIVIIVCIPVIIFIS